MTARPLKRRGEKYTSLGWGGGLCPACVLPRWFQNLKLFVYVFFFITYFLYFVQKCYNFLASGEIAQDEDGMDEQCRWCGEGGRLTICDKCPRAFCKGCIMRNFGRASFTAVSKYAVLRRNIEPTCLATFFVAPEF